jgi:hypothetical protein
MFSVFRTMIDRFKALFVMHAALELEADLIATSAKCKAELLRQADRYDEEGLHGIAQHLRQQVKLLSTVKSLDRTPATVSQLKVEPAESSKPAGADPQISPAPAESLAASCRRHDGSASQIAVPRHQCDLPDGVVCLIDAQRRGAIAE